MIFVPALLAGALLPAAAETAGQLFPPPPLAPLAMTAVNGAHVFNTEHSGVFNGHRIRYRITVAETIIEDPGAVPAADLYSFSYVAEGIGNAAARPVMFIFNGGPGASSVFLHLCSLGPRILRDCTPAGTANPATPLSDNSESPLDVADLVFIDPTDTGWSHTLPGVSPEQFHSVDGDSDEVTALIVWWLRKHGRLGSPVYVYGESYGSMRGVAVVRDLARSKPKVAVAGLMLGGFAITFGRGSGTPDPIWEALRLPTAASMAWHYGKIDNKHQTWEQAVDKAAVFARTQYVGALMLGEQLDVATRRRIIERLPALSGIPESYLVSHHTIEVGDFATVLLHDRRLVLDDNNGLWTRPAGAKPRKDGYVAYSKGIARYASGELRAQGLGSYQIITPNDMQVFESWNFRTSGAPSLEVTLAQEMRDDPHLRLLVVQGRYDNQTQVADTRYVLDQTDIPRQQFTMAYFDGGHMLEPKPEVMTAYIGSRGGPRLLPLRQRGGVSQHRHRRAGMERTRRGIRSVLRGEAARHLRPRRLGRDRRARPCEARGAVGCSGGRRILHR
ncbi:MAG: S10 family serine carboxypeptidase-like protein [Steroidobacteraceae bacterium]